MVKLPRTQFLLLLLLTLLLAGILAGLHVLTRAQIGDAREVVTSTARERARFLSTVVDLKGRSLEMLGFDYSVWDEMVDFVTSGDPEWARVNLDTGLDSFRVDAAWVLAPDFRLVHAAAQKGDPGDPPALPDGLARATGQARFARFFAQTARGLAEVRVNPIQPTADTARASEPLGWFVVSQWWDDALLDELGRLVDGEVTLLPAGPNATDGVTWSDGTTTVTQVLRDRAGQPLRGLVARIPDPLFQQFLSGTRRQAAALMLGLLAVVAIVALLLWRMLGVPMGRIAKALGTGKAKPLARLLESRSEFGEVARLIDDYFRQRERLEREMDERKSLQEQLRQMAFSDALTGLPNRIVLHERLPYEIRRCGRWGGYVALLYVDLDRFKEANDRFGHEAGDAILVETARRLGETVRQSDTVCRLGGDEFAVLVTGTGDQDRVSGVAQRIRESVARPYELPSGCHRIAASIGIAVFPGDGTLADEVLRSADTAMYRAKEQGGDRFEFYRHEMSVASTDRIALVQDLRRAIERREFIPYFQPQVDLTNGRVCGAEALVRWQHPSRGILAPGAFLGVAEESGAIVAIGGQVFQAAFAEARSWKDEGLAGIVVAVNLSGREFARTDLAASLVREAQDARLEPCDIELEITETSAIEDFDRGVASIEALRAAGFRIAIDDFGTGYSSLGYLQRIPFDTLKIGQTFVRDIEKPANRAILEAVRTLAHRLGAGRIVVEGVETTAQLACVQEIGLTVCQGYLFSKPVPASEVKGLLSRPFEVPSRT